MRKSYIEVSLTKPRNITLNGCEYVQISIFFLPLLELKSITDGQSTLIMWENQTFLKKSALTKADTQLIHWKINVDREAFYKMESTAGTKGKSYVNKYLNYNVNLHTYICTQFNLKFEYNPSNIDILYDNYEIFLKYFYLNNVPRAMLTTSSIENYIDQYYETYNTQCLYFLKSNNRLNSSFGFFFILSLVEEKSYFNNANRIDLKATLKVCTVLWATLFYIKEYKNKVKISDKLQNFIKSCCTTVTDRRNTEAIGYLEPFFEKVRSLFDLDIGLEDYYVYIEKNPLDTQTFQELINAVNYVDNLFKYFNFYAKSVYSKTLWLINNTEISYVEKDNANFRIAREVSYVLDIKLLKQVKNYNVFFYLNKDFINFLGTYFNLPVTALTLIWPYSFNIKNVIYENRNIVQYSRYNNAQSSIHTESIIATFKELNVAYNHLGTTYLEPTTRTNPGTHEMSVDCFELEELADLVLVPIDTSLSGLSYQEFVDDAPLKDIIRVTTNLEGTVAKNFLFLVAMLTNSLINYKTNISESYMFELVIRADYILKKLTGAASFNEKFFFIMELKNLLDRLIALIDTRKINTVHFLDVYERLGLKVNVVELTEDIKSQLRFLKNTNKICVGAPKPTEIDRIIPLINFFKKYLIGISKLLSKYYSYYYNLNVTINTLNINLTLKYSPFLDFRGRVYVHNTNQSWVGNTLLRYGITLTLDNAMINKPNIDNFLTEFNEGRFLKIIDYFQLETSPYHEINNRFYHAVYLYIEAMGCSVDPNQPAHNWLTNGLTYLKENTTENLIIPSSTKVEEYNKLKNYIAIIQRAVLLFKVGGNEELLSILLTNTIVFDSVTNGYTHIVGGFKHRDKKTLGDFLHTANYYQNEVKNDIYKTIAAELKKDLVSLNGLEKKFKSLFPNKIDYSWEDVKTIFLENIDLIITRTSLKKPIMTVFYGSSFGKWKEAIFEYLVNNKELITNIKKNEKKIPTEILLNELAWIASSLLNINFKARGFPKFTEEITEKLKKLNPEKIQNIVIRLDSQEISLLYKKVVEDKQILVDNIFNKKNIMVFTVPYLKDMDVNKTGTAFLANCCHTFDAYICREFILQCRKNNIPALTIHDCFIIPVAYYTFAKQLYNSIYYSVYKEYNFKDVIYIKYTNNTYEQLFEQEGLDELKSNWVSYREDILSAKYNLIFE